MLCLMVFCAACGTRHLAGNGVALPASLKAKEINEVLSQLENPQLKTCVDEWLGVRYRYGGADKSGVDCSGLAGNIYKVVYHVSLPRSSYDMAVNTIQEQAGPVEGDLLFFAFGGTRINHVGVYLGNNSFIHSSTTRGVVIDNLKLPEFARAYKGLRKIN